MVRVCIYIYEHTNNIYIYIHICVYIHIYIYICTFVICSFHILHQFKWDSLRTPPPGTSAGGLRPHGGGSGSGGTYFEKKSLF